MAAAAERRRDWKLLMILLPFSKTVFLKLNWWGFERRWFESCTTTYPGF
jgi:hypothetical protein